MKYKLIAILTFLLILLAAFFAQNIQIRNKRYHQHLEAKPKAPCTNHTDTTFCTHLPLMSITTDESIPNPFILDSTGKPLINTFGVPTRNYETVSANITYYDQPLYNNHLTDIPQIEEKAVIRTRGASSRLFDKKGYALKFKQQNLIDNKDISLSNMAADSDWVLNGPFLDKSWIRNYLCYNLSGEIMDYAPNVRFIELFLNGEYMGLYLLIEEVKYNDIGRINITQTDPDLVETSYIIGIDRDTSDPFQKLKSFGSVTHFTPPSGSNHGQLEILYPSKTLTTHQKHYIENDVSKFEKALFSFDYKDPKKGYAAYIDIDSFVDYFILNEFTLNYDSPELSTYLYKDVRGKLKLCVWDFNSAFDYYEYSLTTPHSFNTQNKMWYLFLFKDDYFVQSVITRYQSLRKTYLSDDYLINYIDETVAYLGPALDRNNEKWGYSFEQSIDQITLKPVERNPKNHSEAINQLKSTIIERGNYMDNTIESLYALSHGSINKKYNHNPRGE